MTQEFTVLKKFIFQLENKNRTAIKNELKYSPVSEGNISIAEPNLEVKSFEISCLRAQVK